MKPISSVLLKHPYPFIYIASVADFPLHRIRKLRQKLDGLQILKYLLSCSLQKKFAGPWFNLFIPLLVSTSGAGPPWPISS